MPAESGDGASVLEVATTATDARGVFVFPMVPSGSYTVLAVRTGSASSGGAAPSTVSEVPGAWASQSVSVGDAKVSNIILTLRPGTQVTGRVEFSGASERPAGERLRQLPITHDPLAAALPQHPAFVITDRSGRRVRRPRILTGTIRARHARFRAGMDASVRHDRHPRCDGRSHSSGRRGRHRCDRRFTDQPAEVSGTVSSATAAVDLDASVFVFPTDRARWPDARVSTRTFRTVRVSKTGAFRVPNMIPGEYFAVAALDDIAGEWPDERLLAKLAPLASTIRLDPNQKQAVKLRTVTVR